MREAVLELVQEAGRFGLGWFPGAGAGRQVEEKRPLDLVARADREIEAFLLGELARL